MTNITVHRTEVWTYCITPGVPRAYGWSCRTCHARGNEAHPTREEAEAVAAEHERWSS